MRHTASLPEGRDEASPETEGLGFLTEAADTYRKAIAHDAYLEETNRELMRCQAALGERGRAIRHYEELVELLVVRLGMAPAPETRALHARLRAGEDV